MIEEILLTDKEIAYIVHECLHKNPHWHLDSWGISVAVAKAAQLKLLEWLKERCTEHPQYDEEVGGSKYKVYCSHQRCLVCMSELESKLKEG